jgi:hypothetical protein
LSVGTLITIGPRPRICHSSRHWAPVPFGRWITLSAIVDEGEALSFRVFEQEGQAAIPLDNVTVLHALLVETRRPPRQCFAPVYTQAATDDAARSPALARDRPVKECEVRAWAPFPIRVEEVIGADVILVYRPLHQSHAERLGIEAMVLPDCGGNRRQMVNARELHETSPSVRPNVTGGHLVSVTQTIGAEGAETNQSQLRQLLFTGHFVFQKQWLQYDPTPGARNFRYRREHTLA